MNHVDGDFQERGNSLTLFTNNEDDYGHIKRITDLYKEESSEIANKYDIRFSLLDGDRGTPNEMPCNSDYCPFIYELMAKLEGRVMLWWRRMGISHISDTMDRFNEESLHVSGTIYGTYMRLLAYDMNA